MDDLPEQYLNDDVHVEVPGVQSNSLIKGSSLRVVQIHGHVHLHITNHDMIREAWEC